MTIFIRAIHEDDKATAIHRAVSGETNSLFVIPHTGLRAIPGSPFAYWLPAQLRSVAEDMEPFESGGRTVKQGLTTTDDFRFLRQWTEIDARCADAWPPLTKGGRFRRFYGPIGGVVRWRGDGAEMYAHVGIPLGAAGAPMRNPSYYFQPGISWPHRGVRFSAQAVPAGLIFSSSGKMAFGPRPLELLAVMNSSSFDLFVGLQTGKIGAVLGGGQPGGKFEVGVIQRVPCPQTTEADRNILADLARVGWSLTRSLDTVVEVSHAFVLPAVLQVGGVGFGARVSAWAARVAAVDAELERVQDMINMRCFELYGISESDRQSITEGFGVSGNESADIASDDEEEAEESAVELDPEGLAAGLVSWAVGVAVGRFDVRAVTGVWPSEPDPFDPLPVCSPAMLTGGDGLPSQSTPDGYPLLVSPVLVEDQGHDLDLGARVRAVFEVVFGGDADRWWTEVGAVLDPRSGDGEAWLRRVFFDYHLKTYSKSRRKAPIMWPLGTRSGSYRVWLYAHRVTMDSVFRVLNDIVGPKLHAEERRLSDLRQEAGSSPSASQRKAIDAQETFVAELREFRDELAAVAPLWAPDLNDGVVIVLAPLWRLFAHHRGWSSELKDRWKKLAVGDYDWAQLAMRLWPERVIPKCAEDRSLAIAHGLEDVFWVADKDNPDKWHPRTIPTTPVEELIAARANSTITTARQHPTP